MVYYYKTEGHGHGLIHRVEVERETEASVWIDGQRRIKNSPYHGRYWPTWDEAKAHLIRTVKNDISSAERILRLRKSTLTRKRRGGKKV